MGKLTKAEHLKEARKRIEELMASSPRGGCWLCVICEPCKDCLWTALTGRTCFREKRNYITENNIDFFNFWDSKAADLIRDIVIPRILAEPETSEVFRQKGAE